MIAAAHTIAGLLLVWACFLAYVGLRANWRSLRPEVKLAGIVVVLIGFVLDVILNWTLGLTLGITKDATLSQKCKRLRSGSNWRAKVAGYICGNWLNPFDPTHC